MNSPFRTWNGVEAYEFAPGVTIHAIGGEQVLMCRVNYAPGARIPEHAHHESEQLLYMVEGDLTLSVDGRTATLAPGDVAVINKGVKHDLFTEDGCVFIEALSPVPRDHVPDPDRDLVLGPAGGAGHVDR